MSVGAGTNDHVGGRSRVKVMVMTCTFFIGYEEAQASILDETLHIG